MCAQVAYRTESTVVRSPGVCSGYAHIAGTKLPVWAIVSYLKDSSVEDVLRGFPYLSRDAIDTALDYYKEHKEEVDGDQRDSQTA